MERLTFNREAYLVPYDGDPNYLSVTGYPLKDFMTTPASYKLQK